MGKIRVATLGNTSEEKEQKRRAEARRETKKSKKSKVEGVGLKSLPAGRQGGQRVAVIEGGEMKPEFRKLVDEVESGETREQTQAKKTKEKKTKTRSKRYQEIAKLVDKTKLYPSREAVALIK